MTPWTLDKGTWSRVTSERPTLAPFRDFNPTDAEILREWRLGKTSADIASAYFVREGEIANRLPRILADARNAEKRLWR